MELNEDYRDLKRQLRQIKQYLASNPKDNKEARLLYCSLSDIYCHTTNKNKFMQRFIKKYIADLKENNRKYCDNFYEDFQKNQKFHRQMTIDQYHIYQDIIKQLEIYEQTKEFQRISHFSLSPIDEKSGQDIKILHQFFKEVDPELENIYQDLKRQGRIYNSQNYLNLPGFTITNYLQNTANIFIKKEPICTIGSLQVIVHELGHVKDEIKYQKEKNDLYREVISLKYQEQFLTFLIDNNLYRDEAKFYLYYFLHHYIAKVTEIMFYSIIPEQYDIKEVVEQTKTMENLEEWLNNHQQEYYITLSSDDESPKKLKELWEESIYGYGFLLGNSIMVNPSIEDKYFALEKQKFQQEEIQKLNLTEETLAQNVKTLSKQYFH